MRAAMSACSVSGHAIGRAVARAALDEHADGLLDEERVALGALDRLLRECLRPLARRAGELIEQLLDELRALLLGQRIELDRGRAHAAPAPAGARVEELGPREAEDQDRRANPVGDVLDEVEQRRLGPVDVLEEQDQRLYVGDALHDLARRPRDLLRAALALERLHQPGRETEHVRDGLLGAALAQLLERLLEWIVVRDAGGGLHHLAQRPVRDALAVRKRTAHENARALDAVEELSREAALPDARLAVDREEVSAPVAQAAVERVLEQLELGLAADERRTRPERADRGRRACRPRATRGVAVDALELERAGVLDHEAPGREPIRGRPDEDLAGTGRLLESSGEVHGLARGERRVRCRRRRPRRPRSRYAPRARARPPLRGSRARARSRAGASSSCACGTPNAAMTASPANFSTMPPCCDDAVRDRLEELASRGAARPPGRLPVTSRVESTMSTNRTEASLRSTSEV